MYEKFFITVHVLHVVVESPPPPFFKFWIHYIRVLKKDFYSLALMSIVQ